jgi:hypothetical protein
VEKELRTGEDNGEGDEEAETEREAVLSVDTRVVDT